ncbi:MAG TPA: rhomboid family intramembrane serine protease [Verrucomicrobiae bacterium]|nr:rhomboid family intramembrane serine protease [Verrucomicrobiae bacterium]
MPLCPSCKVDLITVRQREGIYFACDQCGGRAVTVPQTRRTIGERLTQELLRKIRNTTSLCERTCPYCDKPMLQFYWQDPPLQLEACKPCNLVWFDAQEFEALPEHAIESVHEAQLRAAEALGTHRIEEMKKRDRAADSEDAPDETWKMIAAFLGFPVERYTDPLESRPWATWILSAVIALASIAAFFNLQEIINALGFVPAHALRYGGITSITSFFLHAGIFHLLGNLYFLLIFGDNVEDKLGWKKYLLMIFGATLLGDGVHWIAQSGSQVPCIGASGGISAVLVFYALQFPRAELGFMLFLYWRPRWFYIPAWVALALWLLMQTFGVYMQLRGFSNVAATAHLGGAALGFVFWLCWKKYHQPAPA